jgi:hypothetical protein
MLEWVESYNYREGFIQKVSRSLRKQMKFCEWMVGLMGESWLSVELEDYELELREEQKKVIKMTEMILQIFVDSWKNCIAEFSFFPSIVCLIADTLNFSQGFPWFHGVNE